MQKLIVLLTALFALVFSVKFSQAEDFTLTGNDEIVIDRDYGMYSRGELYDQSQAQIVAGGEVYRLIAHDTSSVIVEDGGLYTLSLRDSSSLIMSGGSIQGDFYVSSHSQVNISGGSLNGLQGGEMGLNGSGSINITGGDIAWMIPQLRLEGFAQVDYAGLSSFDLAPYGIHIADGTVGKLLLSFSAHDSSSLNIIEADTDVLMAYNSSTISISGNSTNAVGIMAMDSSTVNITGVSATQAFASNNSTVNMSGGYVGYMPAGSNGTVNMSGGHVGNIGATSNGTVNMSGGHIDNLIHSRDDGTVYLDGTAFEVNGISLEYGDKLSNFAPLIENSNSDYYAGTITGILSDNSALNTTFRIYNTADYAGTGDIIIIPDPCTSALFALGALAAIRRRRAQQSNGNLTR